MLKLFDTVSTVLQSAIIAQCNQFVPKQRVPTMTIVRIKG